MGTAVDHTGTSGECCLCLTTAVFPGTGTINASPSVEVEPIKRTDRFWTVFGAPRKAPPDTGYTWYVYIRGIILQLREYAHIYTSDVQGLRIGSAIRCTQLRRQVGVGDFLETFHSQ